MAPENVGAGAPPPAGAACPESWREPALKATVWSTAIGGSLWIGAVLVFATENRSAVSLVVGLVLLAAVWAAAWRRQRPAVTAAVCAAFYLGAGVIGMMQVGAASGPALLFLLFVLLTALFLGGRAAIGAAGLVALAYVVCALGWARGWFPLGDIGYPVDQTRPAVWLIRAAVQLLGITAIVAIVCFILQNLRRTIVQLRQSEQKFARVFRASPDGIAISDLATGRIQEVNASFLALFGWERGEVIGRTALELGLWREAAERDAMLRELRDSGAVRARERAVQDRAGRPLFVLFSAETVDLGGQQALLVVSCDITDRKRTEEALAASERTMRAILDQSFQFVGLLDVRGRLVRPNQTGLDAVGAARADVEGRYFWDTPWWTHSRVEQDRLRQAVQRAVAGEFVRFETTHRHADGRLLTIDFSLKPVRDESEQVIGMIAEGRDTTELQQTTQALRDSTELITTAFRASPDPISVHELETGRILDMNESYERLVGRPRSELLGRTSIELGFWAEPARRGEFIKSLQRDGRVRDFSLGFQLPGGERRTFLLSAECVQIGGRACNVTMLHDITAEEAATRALRESEERFAKAFRASPDAISISEAATGRFIDINEGFERLFACERAEVIGRTSLELGLWAEPEARARVMETLLRDGRLRDVCAVARTRRGELRTCQISGEIIQVGDAQALALVVRDITEQLRAEQALRASEEKFSKAFRSCPDSITLSDYATGRLVEVNEGFVQTFGIPREEALGRTTIELGLYADPGDRQRLLDGLQATGVVRDLEFHGVRRGGGAILALLSAELIEIGGGRHLVTIVHDITERRRAEEAQQLLESQLRQAQKLEALGTLAGGIAHDFNNILTALIAYTELAIIDADDPAKAREHLREVQLASARARELVKQILAFSRRQKQERRPMQLQLVVREVLRLIRSTLPKTIEIDADLDADAPQVLADPTQIHQVLMNLCTNAAQAMGEGIGVLAVQVTAADVDAGLAAGVPGLRPGRHVRLVVRDTGHGMTEEVMKHLFEPFFTTKEPGVGTGLGLAVVHGILREHDAAMTVESRSGSGTTFTIYFPVHEPLAAAGEPPPAETAPGRGERVLFVDDEQAICDSAELVLRRLGYEVAASSNPVEALETFRADPGTYDLVVTDLTMPRVTGVELTRAIRELRVDIPIVMLSGFSGAWTPERVRAIGVHELVMKPLSLSTLAGAVRRALDSRREE